MGTYNSLTNKYIIEYPIEKRLEAYNKCLELNKSGLKTIEIWRMLKGNGIDVKYETLGSWIRGGRSPYKRLNTIKDDKKLPYVIGLLLGGGYFYKVMKNGSYSNGRIVLGVKDKDLAQKFAAAISHVFGDKRTYKVNWSESKRVYVVELHSKELVELLLQDFNDLKKIIKTSEPSFIRGFFDAEGCINIKYQKGRIYPRIFLTNSDMRLINYVKDYFQKIGISSSIQINTMGGKEKTILGKKTKTIKDCYNLVIENFLGVKRFAEKINFTVNRKKDKLNKVIDDIEKYGNKIRE